MADDTRDHGAGERLMGKNNFHPMTVKEMDGGQRKRPKSLMEKVKKGLLPILTVFSVVAGVVVGLLLRVNAGGKWTQREVMYIQFPGDLFLNMLKAMVIPLMVSSVTSAVASLDLSLSKKIGIRALIFYLGTTFSAVIEGIILVSLIHPGRVGISAEKIAPTTRNVLTVDTLLDLVRNMFPPNLIQSCISQFRTILVPPDPPLNVTGNWTPPADLRDWKITGEFSGGSNVLGLIVFSLIHGFAIGQLGPVGKPLLNVYHALDESIMLITRWILWLSPMGVFFLVVAKILEADSFAVVVGQLGMYFLTVMLGLFIHGCILLPGIYAVAMRRWPFKFLANMSRAFITAFATGSSAATLSVSLACLEEGNKVDPRVTRFVMPIGATVNMDGTALYEAVAVIFISQIRGMVLSFGQLVAVSLAATLASIGAAAIPQAGLVTMVMVLDTVGLPAEDVSLIFAVDWLLDRFRTTVNVVGDALGAGIIEYHSRDELAKLPKYKGHSSENHEEAL